MPTGVYPHKKGLGKGRIHSLESRIKISIVTSKRIAEHPELFKGFKKGHHVNKGRIFGPKSSKTKMSKEKLEILTQNRWSKKEKLAGRKKSEQCEICGSMGKICFDHNHQTGKFRGWLCTQCNSSLGFARDNCEILQNMVEYLRKNR